MCVKVLNYYSIQLRSHSSHWPMSLVPLWMFVIGCVWLFATPWIVACQTPLFRNSPGKNTGVDCHSLLQGIFQTQGLNPHLLPRQANSLPLVPPGVLVIFSFILIIKTKWTQWIVHLSMVCLLYWIKWRFSNTGGGDFPGGSVVTTSPSNARVCGFVPWLGSQDPTCFLVKKTKT